MMYLHVHDHRMRGGSAETQKHALHGVCFCVLAVESLNASTCCVPKQWRGGAGGQERVDEGTIVGQQ